MRPELIVAVKELRDHLASKRFIIIFGIMMLMAMYAISTGMDAYNQKLDDYKNLELSSDYKDRLQLIDEKQQLVQAAQENNQSPESYQYLQQQLDALRNPAMPSILDVFQSMVLLITFIGMVLGASLGFDQIAREKDEGSLKFLVSSPVYRDAIINGKTIGAITTLAAAMGIAFIIAVAIAMLKGVVPGPEDLVRLFLFFIASLLYCTLFFALSMIISALAKNTAMAAIMTVGLVFAIVIMTALTLFLADVIATSIVGPAPTSDSPQVIVYTNDSNSTDYAPNEYDNTEFIRYMNKYGQTRAQIAEVLSIFSPVDDFSRYMGYGHAGIGTALLTRQASYSYTYGTVSGTAYYGDAMTLADSLGMIWIKVLALIVEMLAAFGIAYIAFMRADVR